MNTGSKPMTDAELEQIYRQMSVEEPPAHLDRQILAAAERELAAPNKRQLPHKPWWKRLLLPLYVTTTFTFTAIGAHWLWPEPVGLPPGTGPGPVSVDLQDVARPAQSKKARQAMSPPVMEHLQPPAPPKTEIESLNVTQEDSIGELLIELNKPRAQSRPDTESATSEQQIQTDQSTPPGMNGKHSAALEYPDKEIWAKQIVGLFKAGRASEGREALLKFKQRYPNYPIEEQIQSLK